MSDYTIQDDSTSHIYRTELPNIIFEIGLSPQLIGVYAAIKRAAGDKGQCVKSEKTLASQLVISKKTLRRLISVLTQVNIFINKSLLTSEKRISANGDRDTNLITINDIWPENYKYFSSPEGGRVKFTPPRVNITQGVGQNLPKGRVNFTYKEEPLKKNPIKKNPLHPPNPHKKSGGGGNDEEEKIIKMIEACKKQGHPFTSAGIYAAFHETSGFAVQEAILKFTERSKKLPPLDFPDSWLKKNSKEFFEFQSLINRNIKR